MLAVGRDHAPSFPDLFRPLLQILKRKRVNISKTNDESIPRIAGTVRGDEKMQTLNTSLADRFPRPLLLVSRIDELEGADGVAPSGHYRPRRSILEIAALGHNDQIDRRNIDLSIIAFLAGKARRDDGNRASPKKVALKQRRTVSGLPPAHAFPSSGRCGGTFGSMLRIRTPIDRVAAGGDTKSRSSGTSRTSTARARPTPGLFASSLTILSASAARSLLSRPLR